MKKEQQSNEVRERPITLPDALLLGFSTELPIDQTAGFLETLDVKKGEKFLSHLPHMAADLTKPWLDLCENARNAMAKIGKSDTELDVDELLSLSVFTRSYEYRSERPVEVIDAVEATFSALSRDEGFTRRLSIEELTKAKRLIKGLQEKRYRRYSGFI